MFGAGEMLLIDYAPELDHYTSDITRSWPIDGEVTPRMEEIYRAVLAARGAESREQTVEAARGRVEAEFTFEKYVLGISEAAHAPGHAEPAGDAGGHRHG